MNNIAKTENEATNYVEYLSSASKVLTFTKTTKSWVSEDDLKSLVRSGILTSYKLTRSAEGSEVELTFTVFPRKTS